MLLCTAALDSQQKRKEEPRSLCEPRKADKIFLAHVAVYREAMIQLWCINYVAIVSQTQGDPCNADEITVHIKLYNGKSIKHIDIGYPRKFHVNGEVANPLKSCW